MSGATPNHASMDLSLRAPNRISAEEPMAGKAAVKTRRIATPRSLRKVRPDGSRYAPAYPSIKLTIAPDAAHTENAPASRINQTGRCPFTANWFETNSSEPGGTTSNRNLENTCATDSAFTFARIAAMEPSTGKNASNAE